MRSSCPLPSMPPPPPRRWHGSWRRAAVRSSLCTTSTPARRPALTRNFCARAPQLCRRRACRCTALSPATPAARAAVRGSAHTGSPPHRCPLGGLCGLGAELWAGRHFCGDPESSARERSIAGTFCTTGELCLPVACAPAMRRCTTAPLPAARIRPRGLCGIRNPGSTPALAAPCSRTTVWNAAAAA